MMNSLARRMLFAISLRKSYSLYWKRRFNLEMVLPTVNKFSSQTFNQDVCWKCGLERKNITKVFCEECNTVQNPYESANYFKIFNLEEKFDIDPKVLQGKYRRLQSVLHPDKFTTKSEEERNISENFSSLVNKAYNELQQPLKRAEHLLKLKGDIGEKEISAEPEFLIEMMERNEEMENITDPKKLRELNLKNKNELEKIAKDIDQYFKENNLEKVKQCILKMKFYSSLGHRINSVMRELGIVD
ncbi:iron-sulfur cluster co-chaperone protein HscB [Cylas formicarius]|uniref:iron-sulfur cluster co-chaperone protein HscB n=1 Tax=Cylas formicarius TaxID=197179 RepID=UPI002958B331|nr:iron-sulfur cluster co-chaperone protein HscB [Cylas formicarius]